MSDLLQRNKDGLYLIPVRPCPPWCTDSADHANVHPADRRCYSDEVRFAASKGEPVFYDGPTINDFVYSAPEVEVCLTRPSNSDETLVLIHHGEGTKHDAELHLTPAEAEALVFALGSALATHRVSEAAANPVPPLRTAQPTEPPACPTWCRTPGECTWQPLTALGAHESDVPVGTWLCDHPAGEVDEISTYGRELNIDPGAYTVTALLDGVDFLPDRADAEELHHATELLLNAAAHIEGVLS